MLVHQIQTHLHEREGAAPSNFAAALEPSDSELAQQITKDLEERLTNRIVESLRELGRGFAFVGRQVHLGVDGDDFYVDCSDSWIIPIAAWAEPYGGGVICKARDNLCRLTQKMSA